MLREHLKVVTLSDTSEGSELSSLTDLEALDSSLVAQNDSVGCLDKT